VLLEAEIRGARFSAVDITRRVILIRSFGHIEMRNQLQKLGVLRMRCVRLTRKSWIE